MGRKRIKKSSTFMGLNYNDDRNLFKHCKDEGISVRKFVKDAIVERLKKVNEKG